MGNFGVERIMEKNILEYKDVERGNFGVERIMENK